MIKSLVKLARYFHLITPGKAEAILQILDEPDPVINLSGSIEPDLICITLSQKEIYLTGLKGKYKAAVLNITKENHGLGLYNLGKQKQYWALIGSPLVNRMRQIAVAEKIATQLEAMGGTVERLSDSGSIVQSFVLTG